MSLFDDAAKALADRSISRRETLRKLGAGLAASVFGVAATACDSPTAVPPEVVLGDEEARHGVGADKVKHNCKRDEQPCKTNGDCCTGVCDPSGRCGCKSGTTNCGGTCTYPSMDPNNCGACGNVCPTGTSCVNGTCSAPCATCPPSQVACGGICVNLQTSTQSCGACGNICAAGAPCVAGVCINNRCRSGFLEVGGICIPEHATVCGYAGNACAPEQVCNFGVCVAPNMCPPGLVNCSGVCLNPGMPCDGCASGCAAGQICSGGACSTPP